jgi:anti-sigma factor ChrR (cupin superfamily)
MTIDQPLVPRFLISDSDSIPWSPSRFADGVEVKNLGKADGLGMQLVRFAPGAVFPDHLHTGPELLYVLEGEAIRNGVRLRGGFVGIAEKGTIDRGFRSDTGCTFLLVYDLEQEFDSIAP